MSNWIGIGLGLGTSACWALGNLCIQRASRRAVWVGVLWWSQVLGALLLGLTVWGWAAARPPGVPVAWGWVVGGGLASGLAYMGMIGAFAGGPVSVVAPLLNSWALVAAVIGVVVFAEPLTVTRVTGGLLVIGGAGGLAAVVGQGGAWHGSRARVLGCGVLSALGFGVMVAALGPLSEQLGFALAILALWGVQWLALGPWLVARKGALRPPRGAWGAIAGMGLLEVVGLVFLQQAQTFAPLTVVAPAASLSSLFSVGLGWAVLDEQVGWRHVLLAGLIAGGIGLLGFE